jgi:hypothetical protein
MDNQFRDCIVNATIIALRDIRNPRLFKSERGYQGELYCKLRTILDDQHILNEDRILEMEYQKVVGRHGTDQRPDIILHVPQELRRADLSEYNFAVWALKKAATPAKAKEDFENMDLMFDLLGYPLGIFINISSEAHQLQHYAGKHRTQIIAFAVSLKENKVVITHAWWENDNACEKPSERHFDSFIV